jgi:hypothetical protein
MRTAAARLKRDDHSEEMETLCVDHDLIRSALLSQWVLAVMTFVHGTSDQ